MLRVRVVEKRFLMYFDVNKKEIKWNSVWWNLEVFFFYFYEVD